MVIVLALTVQVAVHGVSRRGGMEVGKRGGRGGGEGGKKDD
jgi:hypothetical protein